MPFGCASALPSLIAMTCSSEKSISFLASRWSWTIFWCYRILMSASITMNFKTHAPARRKGATLLPNIYTQKFRVPMAVWVHN
jgi:hypothetical protein